MNRMMMTTMTMAALTTVGACQLAWAQDRATLSEAKALAEQAAVHVSKVGPDNAFKDFSTSPQWKSKDLYVFAYDMKGDCLASGGNAKLIGTNQIEMKDPKGKPIIKEFIAVAQKGSGTVDYNFAHPQTKEVEGKTTYVIKLANYDGFVGVGAYSK